MTCLGGDVTNQPQISIVPASPGSAGGGSSASGGGGNERIQTDSDVSGMSALTGSGVSGSGGGQKVPLVTSHADPNHVIVVASGAAAANPTLAEDSSTKATGELSDRSSSVITAAQPTTEPQPESAQNPNR